MITHCFQCKARLIDQRTCPNGCEQNPLIKHINDKDKTIAELTLKLVVAERALDMAVNSINEDTVYMLPIQSSLFIQQAQQEVK